MKSEFNYTPSHNPPCYKGTLCKHHRETNGKCRSECDDYKEFQQLKNNYYNSMKSVYVQNSYKQESALRMHRRYG